MPKPIDFSLSSLVDLKAEVFRKQNDFAKKKSANAEINANVLLKKNNKKLLFVNSKDDKRSVNTIKPLKTKTNEKTDEEERQLSLSRERLLQKTKLYEKLAAGLENDAIDDEGNSAFLVNFEGKVIEKEKHSTSSDDEEDEKPGCSNADTYYEDKPSEIDDEWVDFVDSFGRTRRCMRKDLEKFKETDKKLKLDKRNDSSMLEPGEVASDNCSAGNHISQQPVGPVHYQHVSKNEIWEHGAGYYQFSSDETERQQQMKLLDDLRVQTIERRKRNAEVKDKRDKLMQARLAKIRERKGIAVEEETVEDKNESALGEIPSRLGENESDDESDIAKRLKTHMDEIRRAQHVRPWDVGKKKYSQEQWLEKRRQERYSEFAPPSTYQS